jgi:4'-phosphopantetheinyl transferase EntD
VGHSNQSNHSKSEASAGVFAELEKTWAGAWLKFAGPRAALSLRVAPVAEEQGLGDFSETIQGLAENQREIFKNLQQRGHVHRVLEWLLARQAEQDVLKKVKAEGYRSLSHTKTSDPSPMWILALAVGAEGGPYRRVGVDLESATRGVSDAVLGRLIQETERPWLESGAIEALDFWILKEAAFKATPQNQGSVISSVQVLNWDTDQHEGVVTSPLLSQQGLTCRVKKVEGAGLKAAFAYSFKTTT